MKMHTKLGSVALCLLASVAVGCGSDATGTDANVAAPDVPVGAAITGGFVLNGCNAVGTFNITSANVINYVALDQSALSNAAQMSLQALDDYGNAMQVNQTAQQASSQFQSMLN